MNSLREYARGARRRQSIGDTRVLGSPYASGSIFSRVSPCRTHYRIWTMKKIVLTGLTVGAVLAAACNDANAPANELAIGMASAYSMTPAGFDQLSTSFNANSSAGAFQPNFEGRGRGGGFGPPGHGPGFGLGFMGGGLGGPFMGDGLGPRADDSSCAYSTSTALVTCTFTTRDGLNVTRISKYTTASGQTQAKIDSTTNTVVSTITVAGTATRRDSSKSVVSHTSNQTVAGLAKGSAQRTVNGTSTGTETTTGTSEKGAFTAKRVAGDTIKAVVIPVPTTTNTRPYPTAGSITRSMTATVTITGQAPTTSSRREVVTYDGSATAKVVITQDGKTQNCTLPLPHGRLACE